MASPNFVQRSAARSQGALVGPLQPVFLPLPRIGLTLATYESGISTGPPLLFIHGNSLAASIFQRQWAAPALQAFRLVALDLPGHGQSPDAPEWYAPARLRQVLVAAIRALGCEQALVVAHSYGGHLVLDSLSELPDLQGLLLVGTPPVSTAADLAAAFRLNETGGLLYAATISPAQAAALARYCLRADCADEEVAILEAALSRADGRMRTSLAASIGAGELADEVGLVQTTAVPLAFVQGQEEAMLNPEYFAFLSAPSRWGAPLLLVPGAGHLPFLENPTAFNILLVDFAAYAAGMTSGADA